MKRFKPVIILVALALVGLLLCPLSGYSEDGKHEGHAEHETENHSDEDSISLSENVLRENGITLEHAAPQVLNITHTFNGRIRTNEDRQVHLTPRFSGVITEVKKQLGDKVKKGDLLMTVESNQTLQPYEVRAPMSGYVVKRHAALGELVKEDDEVFEIADLSELWADFYVFPDDYENVKEGQEILITANERKVSSTISFVSAYVDPITQSKFARAVIKNADFKLHPGQFARGEAVEGRVQIPIAIKNSALQKWEGKNVVFALHEGKIVPEEITLGSSDEQHTEVTAGLKSGDLYYAGNTFLLKAELGKSLASHEH